MTPDQYTDEMLVMMAQCIKDLKQENKLLEQLLHEYEMLVMKYAPDDQVI